ncbi:hypothetical protein llap_21717 [Limosa lapponica baueri]|uniref:Uncharacterized protein n=1 Tax=Limosa lapponica baueri TaxID=1758121 RepID=A0A2I0T2F3_LIMLA|nr:hypothetical protein llap_21717 [Limosa lapponica baueri]
MAVSSSIMFSFSLPQMEKEEETREILLPNWQGSGSHGITIDQTDDGVFVKRVQQNSPAAKMGVVKEEGLLWFQSGDDEEYRRIYTTKIKPRLKSEEVLEGEAGGTQSRTITVTRKVTAYTVDVSSHDGAGDLQVLGPEFKILIPSQETTHIMETGVEGDVGMKMGPGGSSRGPDWSVDLRGPRVDSSSAQKLDVHLGEVPSGKVGITASGPPTVGLDLRTRMDPQLPQSHVPGGETGKSVTVEMAGGDVFGASSLGLPRIETNGQMGNLEVGFHLKGPGLEGKGHVSGTDGHVGGTPSHLDGSTPRLQGGLKGPGVEVSSPAMETPPLDVGKINFPVLKMPKFGFPMAGSGPEAPAPQVGAHLPVPKPQSPCPDVTSSSSIHVPASDVSAPSVKGPKVDVGLKGAAPQLEVPRVGIKGPAVDLPPSEVEIPGGKGILKMPHMNFPKFTASDSRGEGPGVEMALPKGQVGPVVADVGLPEVATKGEWKGPTFKKVETPHISLSDVNLKLKGPQVQEVA